MKHYYESHCGGAYRTDEMRSKESLYCEMCNDSDVYLGVYATDEEFLQVHPKYAEEGWC